MRIAILLAMVLMSGCRHYAISTYTQPVVIPNDKARPKPATVLQCDKNGLCYRYYYDGTRSYEEHY